MLLRHGRGYHGKSSWTDAHERYLAESASNIPPRTLPTTSTASRQEADERVERITEALRAQSADWRRRPIVDALMRLRGLEFIAAVTCSPKSATCSASPTHAR